jgi:hypothetical protein
MLLLAACGPSSTTPGRPTVTASTTGIDIANMLFEAGASAPGQFTTAGLTTSGIQGDDVVITWNWLEPDAPVNGVHQYNWAPFDSQIAQWHQAGKRVMLLVRYVGTQGAAAPGCAGPQLMPDWELARIPHTCGMAGEVLPNYFDPTFIADLDGFVAAIGAHYAQSQDKSAIAYARIATGVGGEETAVKGDWRDWPAFQQMAQWGYTPYAWRNWVEARLSSYHQSLPWTTVLNAIDVIVDSANNCSASGPCHFSDSKADPTSGQTGLTIQAQIAYWAAAHGLGIGQQGLAPGYDTGGIREITAYVVAHWPSTFIEFQTDKTENDLGSVQGNIQTAYCYGGKTIEWYPNVATNAAYQQAFAHWDQYVRGQAQPPSGYCNGL